ncbi:hypothetical protein [Glycomyces sp. NPDC047010]|uniref:hypothetical protein n=1 Tax=Glycomyces sp. NPDC047010 TaxID=3155023 RepID=UPI003407DBCE
MVRRQQSPLEPNQVYGGFVNANGTAFVLRASASGRRMEVRLHHDEGPQIAVVCNPTDPAARFIRWQGRLWSSNPATWKEEVKRLAFSSLDAVPSDSPEAAARP